MRIKKHAVTDWKKKELNQFADVNVKYKYLHFIRNARLKSIRSSE